MAITPYPITPKPTNFLRGARSMKSVMLSLMALTILASGSIAHGAILSSSSFENDTIGNPPSGWALSTNNYSSTTMQVAPSPTNPGNKTMFLDLDAGVTTPNNYIVSNTHYAPGTLTEKLTTAYDFYVTTFFSNGHPTVWATFNKNAGGSYNSYALIARASGGVDEGYIRIYGPGFAANNITISNLLPNTWYHYEQVLDPIAHTYSVEITNKTSSAVMASGSSALFSNFFSTTDQWTEFASTGNGLALHGYIDNFITYTGEIPEPATMSLLAIGGLMIAGGRRSKHN